MLNVAIYPRVSSEDQAERGTIENQIEFALKYCDLHQLNIVAWYKDDGVSGTIPLNERPEGSRLLNDAKQGKFDTILVYKLDRLGRSARIILNSVHELEAAGVKVKSMTEPFDTGDAAGRFLLTILAGVADLERSNILDRMWHGANRAARLGKWLGGIVPYGYYVDEESYLQISTFPLPGFDFSEADVISMVFKLTVEQKMTTGKIADYLNALSVPTKYSIEGRKITRGKRLVRTSNCWTPSRIRSILTQTTYKGLHVFGKKSKKPNRELIKRQVPAIVDTDTWDKAQQVLQDNKIESPRSAKTEYLLRSLLKCSICGLTFCGTNHQVRSDGTRRRYYVCNGHQQYRGKILGRCPAKTVPADGIESKIWNDCVEFINNPGLIAPDSPAAAPNESSEEESLLIQSSIAQKENEKESILDLYRKQLISSADVEKQLAKINDEKKTLEERLKIINHIVDEANQQVSTQQDAIKMLAKFKEKISNPENITFEFKRHIIKQLVRRVIVNTEFTEGRDFAEVKIAAEFYFTRVDVDTDRDLMRRPACAGLDIEASH